MATSVGLWKAGAAMSAASIGFGAFGSHALAKRLGEKGSQTWSMATGYLLANGVALLAISQHPKYNGTMRGFARFAGPLIGVGAVVFSGSIYLLLLDRARFRVIGPVTPLGGLSMIAGYLALLF